MLNILRKKQFDRDVKLAKKRHKDMKKLKNVLTHLVRQNPLPSRYKCHRLRGEFFGCWECHIEPDWLLIYFIKGDDLVLIRTGTHADLLK
ncbi:MAG: type II toxin-antitoxin system YafQ family toxin [Gammaproteobacteria bacterium]|jgi:mRNA interferase YafQ